MKEFDKLPKEYFEYEFTQDKLRYSKVSFWVFLIAFGFFEIFLQSAVSYYGCDLIGKFTMNILWFLTLLWLLICVFFSSNKRLTKHRPAYIICHIIGSAFLRIIMLLGFTMFSASTMSDGWRNLTAGNITYIVAAFILIEEFIVNILAWKRTKKCVIVGNFKANGNGFFGKYKERAEKVLAIVTLISRFGITLSLSSIPLSSVC